MSLQLISRNPDLKRLADEGYEIEVKAAFLLLKSVPYIAADKTMKRGTLVANLDLAGTQTVRPGTHVAYFAGEHPCNAEGAPIPHIMAGGGLHLADGVVVNHTMSCKPQRGHYLDYYEKMTTYVRIISGPACAKDPSVSARTHVMPVEDDSVFNYPDSASSRAGIVVASDKLKCAKVAIVGVGGTGSYVLDLLAKCPIREIHLFDEDRYLSHNAFRSPGAPSNDQLREQPTKVAYWVATYSKMHRHVIPHESSVGESNLDQLDGMDFVFLCVDRGSDKKCIVERLRAREIPFIDVGMGLRLRPTDQALLGIVRVTTCTPAKSSHLEQRIPFTDGDADDEYSTNIQVADMNMLNAALAVIRWKKHMGFYVDLEREHFAAYTIDGNALANEELAS